MYKHLKFKMFEYQESNLFRQALDLRTLVFVQEQGVAHELEFDGEDKNSIHFLLYYKNKVVAVARIRNTGECNKLERFAVIKEFRNKGVGRILMEEIMIKFDRNKLYFHSQDIAVPFYQKLGFSIVGEAFYEAEIKHYIMCLKNSNCCG